MRSTPCRSPGPGTSRAECLTWNISVSCFRNVSRHRRDIVILSSIVGDFEGEMLTRRPRKASAIKVTAGERSALILGEGMICGTFEIASERQPDATAFTYRGANPARYGVANL